MKRQINQSFIPFILLIGLCHAALAQTYPTKPIRFIAPFVPGAGTDITARTVAQKLTERLGQQVIVDNRPGATGSIGVDITAKAIPDGYTMCLISASHSVSAATSPKLPYDLTKDLAGISQMTALAYFVVVHPAKVPRAIVNKLSAEVSASVNSPDIAQRFLADGSVVVGSTPEQFTAHVRSEIAKWRKLVKEAKLQLD